MLAPGRGLEPSGFPLDVESQDGKGPWQPHTAKSPLFRTRVEADHALTRLPAFLEVAPEPHLLSCPMMLNIGRNIPATMVPTMPPRKTIIRGSMAAVRLSTASSTSRS